MIQNTQELTPCGLSNQAFMWEWEQTQWFLVCEIMAPVPIGVDLLNSSNIPFRKKSKYFQVANFDRLSRRQMS